MEEGNAPGHPLGINWFGEFGPIKMMREEGEGNALNPDVGGPLYGKECDQDMGLSLMEDA